MVTPTRSLRMTDDQYATIQKILATLKTHSHFLPDLEDFLNKWILSEKINEFEILRLELSKHPVIFNSKANDHGKSDVRMPDIENNEDIAAQIPLSIPSEPKGSRPQPLAGKKEMDCGDDWPNSDGTEDNGSEIAEMHKATAIQANISLETEASSVEKNSGSSQTQSAIPPMMSTDFLVSDQKSLPIHSEQVPQAARPPLPIVLSPITKMAEELIHALVPSKDGEARMVTRAKIEKELQDKLQISRNSAQKAVNHVLKKFDPDNPARRGRKQVTAGDMPAAAKRQPHLPQGTVTETSASDPSGRQSGAHSCKPKMAIAAQSGSPRTLRPASKMAEDLLLQRVPTPEGGERDLTRAEMEHILIQKLGVSRNTAQKAATRAVKRLDPDNPARWGRKRPKARTVPLETRLQMSELRRQGLTSKEIAEQTGFDVRSVSKYRTFNVDGRRDFGNSPLCG